MTLKYYYSFIISLLIGISAKAQQVVVTELPNQKLLPVAHIHRIFQDSEGYMWYGTEGGGLCRDNGYQIDVFRSDLNTPHLLSSNDITCLTEDSIHRIWFGTKQGLYQLDKSNYQITEVPDQGLQQRIDAILTTHDGTIWVATEGIIYHYSREGKRLGSYSSLWNGQSKNIADFYEDSFQRLWILQWGGGILQYHSDTDSLVPIRWECTSAPTQMIEDPEHQCYWIATWGEGVIRFTFSPDTADAGTCHLQPSTIAGATPNQHKSQVLGLLRDSRQGLLWVSAMDDLYAYRIADNQLLPVSTNNFLPNSKKILDRIIEDHSGNLWIPGYSPHSFILSFDNNQIKRYPTSAMSVRTGYPVMADRTIQEKEYYWIWQGRTGLSLYHPLSDQISFASDFPNETGNYHIAKCIEQCRSDQGIWAAGSDARILHIVHQGMKMVLKSEIKIPDANEIHTLHEDDNGYLWIGTENAVYQYLPSEQKLHKIHPDSGTVNAITTTPNGTIYYTTDSQKFRCFMPDGKEQTIGKGENYSSVATAPDGTIWVGTLQGNVYRHSPETNAWMQETNAGNVNGDAVKSLITDRLGHLWILSDQYVKEYNPQNQSFRILHNSDSFINVDYFLSIHTMEDGNICLGGIGAFCLVAPSVELDQSPSSITPVISSLKIDGTSRIPGMNIQQIELSSTTTNLEVSFSTLEHRYAHRISYAYRLAGWNTTWNYLSPGTNTALFSKLPKGNYTLEIKATDIHGCWGQPVTCLHIYRLPAWYETWWAYTLYILLTALFVTGILRLYFNRIRSKQREQMEQQLTQMKFRFFTNISHEFRTPLTLIMTPLSSLLPSLQEEKLKQQLGSIYHHAEELLQLVNQLLDFRKMEMGGEKLQLLHGEINEFLYSTCEPFKSIAESNHIQFSVSPLPQSLYMYFDRNKVHRILYNLLSNAFKFTATGGEVVVSVQLIDREETHHLCISVKDSGKGIKPSALPHIFDRYYQATANEQLTTAGSGIGLHLVKEYVALHQGTVEVESRPDKGTEFRIYLPANQKEAKGDTPEEPTTANSGKSLLLVEDNEEFRQFMYRELSREYCVWEACNGDEAEAIANEKTIDILVSDVMMPGMNGFDLCRRLKQNIKTSHIFVILLTARVGDESELEGYESGADCYLTKPFNMEILHNRIRHFFELQQKRKQLFLTGIEIHTEDITSSKVDEEFLKKAIALVEKNMDNCDYNIELFSDDMCMSRMNLYRKLQSITGQKPTEFIRSIRLKKAARLLSATNLSVVEIAEMVGFSTPSYFSKCFKEMFGVLPTQYHE